MTDLGFCICSSHYTLKVAKEEMLDLGLISYKNQNAAFTFETAPASNVECFFAVGLFDAKGYPNLENEFTNEGKETFLSAIG